MESIFSEIAFLLIYSLVFLSQSLKRQFLEPLMEKIHRRTRF